MGHALLFKWSIAFGASPLVVCLLAFMYFALCDPDRLHSEQYQVKAQSLRMIESKAGPISINPVQIEAIANPSADDSAGRKLLPPPAQEGSNG